MHTLEKRLNYTFENKELLERALYHSSYANEHRGGFGSNERLEFLGDAVLGMVTADYLFHRHPDLPEGDLTRIRAALVCEQSLHEVAQRLGLGEYIKLGHGEELGGGRKRPSILADATESVFAAVYLDGGMEQARRVIHYVLLDREREEAVEERRRDFKTELQELVQRRRSRDDTTFKAPCKISQTCGTPPNTLNCAGRAKGFLNRRFKRRFLHTFCCCWQKVCRRRHSRCIPRTNS